MSSSCWSHHSRASDINSITLTDPPVSSSASTPFIFSHLAALASPTGTCMNGVLVTCGSGGGARVTSTVARRQLRQEPDEAASATRDGACTSALFIPAGFTDSLMSRFPAESDTKRRTSAFPTEVSKPQDITLLVVLVGAALGFVLGYFSGVNLKARPFHYGAAAAVVLFLLGGALTYHYVSISSVKEMFAIAPVAAPVSPSPTVSITASATVR